MIPLAPSNAGPKSEFRMDCRQAREFLEATPPFADDPADRAAAALRAHLQACSACRSTALTLRRVDARMRTALAVTPPPQLLDQLLVAVAAESLNQQASETPSSSAPPRSLARSSTVSRRRLLASVGLVAACVGVGWLFRPTAVEPQPALTFEQLQRAILSDLGRDPADFEKLAAWDATAVLPALDPELTRLSLSAPRKFPLGQHDLSAATGWKFQHGAWSGVLVATPMNQLADAPEQSAPRLLSGRSALTWRSRDGQVQYVCVLHSGSAESFVRELFGGWA